MMLAALQALLGGAIDYAGTFPPASLSLEQATRNYLWYRCQPESWMLGRMVCPASQLDELAALAEKELAQAAPSSTASHSLAVSAIVAGGPTSDEWRENVRRDLHFVRQSRETVHVEAIEMRLPGDVVGQGTSCELEGLLDLIGAREAVGPAVYVELPGPLQQPEEPAFESFVKALADLLAQRLPDVPQKIAFKLRTGGTTPAAFMPSEQLAIAICLLRDHHLPWKATAGLHHPLPRWDASLGVRMHGFVNVLAAAVMAEALNLQAADVANILAEGDPGRFQFSAEGVAWRHLSLEAPKVAEARQGSLVSFGSCSFDEPLDDLRALGWL